MTSLHGLKIMGFNPSKVSVLSSPYLPSEWKSTPCWPVRGGTNVVPDSWGVNLTRQPVFHTAYYISILQAYGNTTGQIQQSPRIRSYLIFQ